MLKNINILNLHKESLKKILNLHENIKDDIQKTTWKVLIYDRYGQDIISPLFTISELREYGVTLHLLINNERDEISEINAIYFVLPSEENINLIVNDLKRNLYSKYYFSFITPISRLKLEYLASQTIEFNCYQGIVKIYDEYLNFISLEKNLFILRSFNKIHISFEKIHNKLVTLEEMNLLINDIGECLFCVFLVIGILPIIRCKKGGPSEMLARELERRIKNHLIETQGQGFSRFNINRPLYFLYDRDYDLTTPLLHSWSYLPLMDDLFNINLNRVTISKDNNTITYDLNQNDVFFENHKFKPFPQVAGNIQSELEKYKLNEANITNLKTDLEIDFVEDQWSSSSNKLTDAVNSLPNLLKQKKYIDMHTNIATDLMEKIKNCKIDEIYQIEQKILSKNLSNSNEILNILNDQQIPMNHKIRLVLISYIHEIITDSDIDKIYAILQDTSIPAIEYIKSHKKFTKILSQTTSQHTLQTSSSYSSLISSIVSKSNTLIVQGVKNLVISENNFVLTKIIQTFFENNYNQQEFLTINPVPSDPLPNDTHDNIIIFVVGGGCYSEYQDVLCLLNKKQFSHKNIIYGCTELLKPDDFLQQLNNISLN